MIITKAQLAREVNLTPSRISQMVPRGLPVRPDGKVDREVAIQWIRDNNPPHRGGWGMGLRHKDRTRPDAQDTTQIPVPPERTARELFEVLVSNAVRTPEILVTAGLRDIDLVHVATEQFVEFVYVLSGDMDSECFPDYDSPGIPNTIDYEALAAKYALEPPNPERVEKFFDAIDPVIYPDLKKDIEKCSSAKDNCSAAAHALAAPDRKLVDRLLEKFDDGRLEITEK